MKEVTYKELENMVFQDQVVFGDEQKLRIELLEDGSVKVTYKDYYAIVKSELDLEDDIERTAADPSLN